MNKKRIIILVIISALLCTSCAFIPQEEELPAAPLLLSQKGTYTMVEVARGDLQNTFITQCKFQAADEEMLSFPISGEPIGQIYVSKGDYVTAGTLLMELECTELKEQVAQQQEILELTQLQVTQGEELLGLYYERCSALDDAAAADPSYASMSASAERMCLRHYNELEILRRQLAIEQAALDKLQAQLRQRQIYAGMDGTVTFVQSLKPGTENLSIARAAVCIVSDLSTSYFSTMVPTHYLERAGYKIGKELDLAFEQGTYTAKITDIAPVADKGYEAYSSLTMEPLTSNIDLANGSSCRLFFALEERENVLYLPSGTVIPTEDGNIVYCLDEKGVRYAKTIETGLVGSRKVDIEAGLAGSQMVEIVSGLEEGELVIK